MSKIRLDKNVFIDIPTLIESRLLVQANSGGGKSWANRYIIEQAFKDVQIIVIDPEGEFSNMRAQYDFVYIGKDGDAPAETRSAALLARRLLETKVSAIIDIYEMSMPERRRFVKLFLEAMVNAPKDLWHDCLVILDEAHKFAPEKEQSEALEAVADMASRGRKRGYCLIPATQRPAKLNKDVAAECNNKLIGRASLDIDRKRSAEELGFTTKEEILSLRNLEPGEFYAFGPAISRTVIKITIGDVNVKPPKRGQGRKTPPSPTEKVKALLSQFKDLPGESKKEADTIHSLTTENTFLKQEIKSHKCPVGPDPKKIREEAEKLIIQAKIEIEQSFDEEMRRFKKKVLEAKHTVGKLTDTLSGLHKFIADIESENPTAVPRPVIHVPMPQERVTSKPMRAEMLQPHRVSRNTEIFESSAGGLTGPEQKVLDALAWCESIGNMTPPNELVAFLSGYMHSRSTGYTNPRGYLKGKGLVEYSQGTVSLTESGRFLAHAPTQPLTEGALQQAVLDRLDGPEKKLLIPLLREYPNSISNGDLCAEAGYLHERSTGYTNPRGKLRSFGLVEYGQGTVRALPILFVKK